MNDPQIAALIRSVRNQTTDDPTELPDDVIVEFGEAPSNTDAAGLDLAAVISDAWGYLARDDRYGSEQAGTAAFSQPQAWAKHLYWRSLSRKGGVAASMGVMKRSDTTVAATSSSEHGV